MRERKNKERKKRSRYTAAEEAFIREHYGKMPSEEIARRLGRSAHAIRLKYERDIRELPEPRGRKLWTESEKERLRQLHAEGVEPRFMAVVLGRTEDAVNYRLWKMKLSRRRHGYRQWRTGELETMRSMRQEGKEVTDIAAALGRSAGSVSAMLSAKRIRKGR